MHFHVKGYNNNIAIIIFFINIIFKYLQIHVFPCFFYIGTQDHKSVCKTKHSLKIDTRKKMTAFKYNTANGGV